MAEKPDVVKQYEESLLHPGNTYIRSNAVYNEDRLSEAKIDVIKEITTKKVMMLLQEIREEHPKLKYHGPYITVDRLSRKLAKEFVATHEIMVSVTLQHDPTTVKFAQEQANKNSQAALVGMVNELDKKGYSLGNRV